MMVPETEVKPIPPRSALEWQALSNEWEQSGLSQEKFCQQKQIEYTTFTGWRSKLIRAKQTSSKRHERKHLAKQAERSASPATLGISFAKLTTVGPEAAKTAQVPIFTVRLPTGIVISVYSSDENNNLKAVLSWLGVVGT